MKQKLEELDRKYEQLTWEYRERSETMARILQDSKDGKIDARTAAELRRKALTEMNRLQRETQEVLNEEEQLSRG